MSVKIYEDTIDETIEICWEATCGDLKDLANAIEKGGHEDHEVMAMFLNVRTGRLTFSPVGYVKGNEAFLELVDLTEFICDD